MTVIGLISDTHGQLRPEVLRIFSDVAHIIHAGDIGSQQILDQLKSLAPVTAVRGNMDRESWARRLPEEETFEIEGISFHVLHDLLALDLDPRSAKISVVVHGHTHKPSELRDNGVLIVNPGSAGPGRAPHPPSIARLLIDHDEIKVDQIVLDRN